MAVESMRGNLSTTGRLRANLAVGGGSEVTITPTYNSGTKIADFTIDNEAGAIYIPEPESNTEILDIPAGNNTTSRTFTFEKKPKIISFSYVANGWGFNRFIVWGSDRSYYQTSQPRISDSAVYNGVSSLVFDDANNSFTITGVNALQAINTSDIVGKMVLQY